MSSRFYSEWRASKIFRHAGFRCVCNRHHRVVGGRGEALGFCRATMQSGTMIAGWFRFFHSESPRWTPGAELRAVFSGDTFHRPLRLTSSVRGQCGSQFSVCYFLGITSIAPAATISSSIASFPRSAEQGAPLCNQISRWPFLVGTRAFHRAIRGVSTVDPKRTFGRAACWPLNKPRCRRELLRSKIVYCCRRAQVTRA